MSIMSRATYIIVQADRLTRNNFISHFRVFAYMFFLPVVVVIVWLLDLQLPMQSVFITTKVVSSNPAKARCIRYKFM